MKALVGFLLGLFTVLLLGAITTGERIEIWGAFEKVGVYRPAFSGITPEGDCYLAVTNTITGTSEIFGITKEVRVKMSDRPFQSAKGGVVVELSQ
jgi:hypothetical protein